VNKLVYEVLKLITPEQLLMALISSYGFLLAISKFSAFIVTKIYELNNQNIQWPLGVFYQRYAEIFAKGAFLNITTGFGFGILLMLINIFSGPNILWTWQYGGLFISLDVHWFLNITSAIILLFGWILILYANILVWYRFARESAVIARTMPWAHHKG